VSIGSETAIYKWLKNLIWYTVIIALCFFFILPFLWMISTAFKTPGQVALFPPEWIPSPFTLRSFREGFIASPFLTYLTNSVIISGLNILGTLLSTTLVAYGFARLNARLRPFWFTIMLSTMMIPWIVTLLPVYVLYSELGWINTYLPLTLPAFLATNSFSIFLLRQFFMGFPKELDEAAKVDGCSVIGILYRIILPNSKAVLFIIAIFTFVAVWNDFFNPLIFLNDPNKFTIAVGLAMFNSSQGATIDKGPLMAVALVSVVPILFLYISAQKYFVQGITTTGLK
jgi:multiple sugar transport system permease protein